MRIYFLFFLLISSQNLLSKEEFSNDDLLRKGNTFYKEGRYDESIEQYRKIVDNGIVNGYIFYNLGNAYFREGKIGYAILYYEKARKFLPRDRDLIANLHFVKTYTQDKIEEKKPSFLFLIFYWLINKFSLKELIIIVSTIFSLTIICSILIILKKGNPFIKNLIISLLVIFLFSIFVLSLKLNTINIKRGVVLVDVVDVKSAPSDDATLEFVIHEGTSFQILETIKDWSKIKLNDGKTGWLTSNTFEQI